MAIERRYCSVCDYRCLAPAGYGISGRGVIEGESSCRGTCAVCGEPVCKNCSLMVTLDRRRKRVCHNCIERKDGNDDRVMEHLKILSR